MSKEKILEDFWSKLRKNLMWRDSESGFVEKHITELINEAIDQTREETIREVEEMLPIEKKITQKDYLLSAEFDYREGDIKEYYNNLIKNIKQSLINLRK
jgi:hypothetical protein